MSEEISETQNAIDDLAAKGRETLANVQDGAQDALTSVTDYIRANPWTAVAGAALLGGVIAVLSKPSPRPTSNVDAVKDWLDDAYARIPSQKQVQSLAESAGLPLSLKQLKKKLHLD